jgi:DNA repair exonuclease SbcCD nuclease subunit
MMQVIILGDIHLGKGVNIGKTGLGANLNSRVVDQINLLDWTLDQAIERDIDDIIVTGDVFEDPKPHPSLIAIFFAWLKKCETNGVNVHIILGNHDMLRSGSVFTSCLDIISEVELPNVTIHKNINTIVIGTTAFTLMPFRDRKSFGTTSNVEAMVLLQNSLVYELAGIPVTYKKVVVGHLAIEGSIPVGDEIDDVTNELFCSTDMFGGYDYVWMGHVHKPQVMKKKNPYIAHVGSMDISNFGETDHEKHIIVFDCNSKKDDFIQVTLPTRALKKFSFTIPKDTGDPTQYILDEIAAKKDDLNRSIIKIDVSLGSPELESVNKSRIEKALLDLGAFNVSSISESKKLSVVKRNVNNKIDTKMDVTSAIKTYAETHVEKDKQGSYIELAMEIYKKYKEEVEK